MGNKGEDLNCLKKCCVVMNGMVQGMRQIRDEAAARRRNSPILMPAELEGLFGYESWKVARALNAERYDAIGLVHGRYEYPDDTDESVMRAFFSDC